MTTRTQKFYEKPLTTARLKAKKEKAKWWRILKANKMITKSNKGNLKCCIIEVS